MNSKISELLRNLSSLCSQLACEFENNQHEVEVRLSHHESEIYRNKDTLKAVAETILERLES